MHGKAWMAEKRACWPTCPDCWEALRRSRKAKKSREYYGTVDRFVSPEASRTLVRRLVDDYGYSTTTIARRAGLNVRRVHVLYRPDFEVQHVRISTYRAIKGVWRSRDASNARYVDLPDADLARAAVRALMLQGYDQRTIGQRVDVSPSAVSKISVGATRYVRAPLQDKLVALTREVGNLPGPSPRTAARARRLGYRPAAADDRLL